MDVQKYLEITIKKKASDLHIIVDLPPMLRIQGVIEPIPGEVPLNQETSEELVFQLMTPGQKEIFLANKEIDFSVSFKDEARFRVNAYHERSNVSASLRLIPNRIPSIEELKLPGICHHFTELRQGFVLITGPTGHGKSTTIASVLDEINELRREHIVTIEDPIEYVHKHKKSIVSQREVKLDTHTWEIALRSILREDPNVVLIGEMRDYDTIAAALTIAETGHLVFASLHTNSAAQTVDRIVDVFPPHQQQQVKIQLAAVMEAVLSQRLVPTIDGHRIVASEVLIATPAVRNAIREGQTHLIDNIIQTSGDVGMNTLEMDLARLVNEQMVTTDEALGFALRPDDLIRQLRRKTK